jgi:tRNA-2-methylthio-N6-dimethylallyladenosine synthase
VTVRRVYLETFGCQMNELDSELVSGQLRALGYRFVHEASDADVVLYNTCSVREHAEQKVWSRLGELKARKRDEPNLVVGVLGCMAERDGVDLAKRMPVVDVLCGPGELDKLPTLLDNAVRTRMSMAEAIALAPGVEHDSDTPRRGMPPQVALQGNSSRRSATLAAAQDTLEMLDLSRAISPLDDDGPVRRSAYVRITRGCNKFCTYCVVPFTRGAEVHRPPDHIIDECKRLADAGVVEVTLLGQTVNHYRFEHDAAVSLAGVVQPQKGRSYGGGHRRDPFAGASVTTFADLLRRIHDEVPAIQRLRFVTSYPRDFGDDVLEVIRDHPRICRYLHVPAQSGSDRLLQLMNRGYSVAEYLEFLDRARAFLHQPEIGRPLMLSGDFIVGFPTETDADFAATLAFVERCRYKNAFIFKYSPRPGTIAFDKLPDDVPEDVKRARNSTLLGAQSRISDAISRAQVGATFEVLVEGVSRRTLRKRGVTQGQQRALGQVAITVGGRALAGARTGGVGASDTGGCEDGCGASDAHVGAYADRPDRAHGPASAHPASESHVQLSGRTDTDLIVFFDAPTQHHERLVGRIVRVRVTGADHLSLQGDLLS